MISYSRLGSMGRLGNQLFQIASTIGIASENKEDYVFPSWKYSEYFKNKIPSSDTFSKRTYVENGFHYSPVLGNDLDLVGYFQSEKYFCNVKNLIRFYFDFNTDLYPEDPLDNFCSIHVRRGDYLNFPDYHPFPGMDYYNRSINYMKDRGIFNFIIFSDDIEWCKSNFSSDFKFSENNSDIKDLCHMSKCKNHIIANSSFSWWGSWLNPEIDKKVVAPRQWFGPSKQDAILDDLYCESWIKI